MPLLELPRTAGCLVCGSDNPAGLHLTLYVDDATNEISTVYTPLVTQIGFEGVIHGGMVATVLDEMLAWAALWQTRTCCLCAELSVRYLKPALVGSTLRGTARVTSNRRRLLTSSGELRDETDSVIATATGKFVPMPSVQKEAFLKSVRLTPASMEAARRLGVFVD